MTVESLRREAKKEGFRVFYDRGARSWYVFDEQTTASYLIGARLTIAGLDCTLYEAREDRERRAEPDEDPTVNEAPLPDYRGAEPLVDEPVPDWYGTPDGGAR